MQISIAIRIINKLKFSIDKIGVDKFNQLYAIISGQ